jgi:hypothetical protein
MKTQQHRAAPGQVPGACEVVLVRAGCLTDAHVIRLGANQGSFPAGYRWTRVNGRQAEPRHAWREVLDVFPDRDSLEAQFGDWQPGCVQAGCQARLRDDVWFLPRGTGLDSDHEHGPAFEPGRLDSALAQIADQAWQDRYSSLLIRVLIQELSTPGEIEDLFVILDRNDLVEAQSLPAAGYEGWRPAGPLLEPAAPSRAGTDRETGACDE